MTTDDKRLATDILLDIDTRLGILEKRIQNSESLLKILLSRLNTALSSQSLNQSTEFSVDSSNQYIKPSVPYISSETDKDNFESRKKTSKFTEAAANVGINIEDDINPVDPFESSEDDNIVLESSQSNDNMEEAFSRGNSRGQRGAKINNSKCSVSQNLNYDNFPIYLANVELLDEKGSLINQTRTNTKGRWMLTLAPGNYQVHVLKRYPVDSDKKPIDVTYPITVPQSDKPVELNPLTLSNGNL